MASQVKLDIRPTASEARSLFEQTSTASPKPTLLPVCITVPSDLLTPSAIYLKLSNGATAEYSFLLESATRSTETVGRYSFIGANPRKVLATGPGYDDVGDPLRALEAQLGQDRVVSIPSLKLPPLTGGAVGYVSYDCIKYFEPKTNRPLKDNLHIPEALFMLFDTIVSFDHFFQALTIITHMRLPEDASSFESAYDDACATIRSTLALIQQPETPLPSKSFGNSTTSQQYSSNVGRHGYESFVTALKSHIVKGDIIQAVPSQRFSRGTSLHPFNIYRTLRTLNPSPYLFFLSCADFHIVGASPECLMKTDGYAPLPIDTRFAYSAADQARSRPRIVNHAIAGTIRRGLNPAEDDELAAELQASTKDRAEHVMLVDLARNDVNRVCHPSTVKVDRLMRIDRFSHVQHLTSEVSGLLRPECTRWDAMRSIFPAGTVSGAPKIRAMELIYELEGEKRGIYAGAAGWFAYDVVRVEVDKDSGETKVVVDEGQMDTCIAIRTMLVKGGVAYLQAGGGIVFDSEKTEEWMETMNKLAANLRCIELAEQYYGDGLGTKSVQEIIDEERRKGDEFYRLHTNNAGA
ncbi:anthranilate synthase component [Parathielavia appendiculata]|uniref:Anthranilate synthase component n=1 Tax=Parathielavia appendiculata TaxID=2587402 RepID=A0AAN6TRV6_9PEZI|nr:anthranilate synthase component [Parathielavia appendiculata]